MIQSDILCKNYEETINILTSKIHRISMLYGKMQHDLKECKNKIQNLNKEIEYIHLKYSESMTYQNGRLNKIIKELEREKNYLQTNNTELSAQNKSIKKRLQNINKLVK